MHLLDELWNDVRSFKLFPALVAGTLSGVVYGVNCVALATMIFGGPLSSFIFQGTGALLFGSVVFCLSAALMSGYKGVISAPQEAPAVMLGALGATVAAAGVAGGRGDALFMTMIALLVVVGVVTGLCFVVVAYFRIAAVFRFIPYTILAGFLSATGWVVCVAGLSAMTGIAPEWGTALQFIEPVMLWKWGPGAVYGLALFLIMRRRNSFPIVVASIVLAVALFHLSLIFLGISIEDARKAGLLMSGMQERGLWPAFRVSDLAQVDWNVIAAQTPSVLAATMVALLTLVMHLNSLELASGEELDMDKEFRITGLAGAVASLGGCSPGCHMAGGSLLNRKLGADTRLTGVVAALVMGVLLFLGGELLVALPVAVIGGLLIFFGLGMLYDWLFDLRKRLHWADSAVVLLIFLTIALFGFVVGVVVGLATTTALLIIRLARTDVVEAELTGRDIHSIRIRSVPESAILLDRGDRIRVYRLHGYVFFGSAHFLVNRIRRQLDATPPPACILLDCAAVIDLDLSAVNAMSGLVRLADSCGTRVAFSSASARIRDNLRRNLPSDIWNRLLFETDLDRGLERCEDILFAAEQSGSPDGNAKSRSDLLERIADELDRHLSEQSFFEETLDRLEPWLEPREYEAGETLFMPGDIHEGLHVVVRGRVSVYDAEGVRLFQAGAGHMIARHATFSTKPSRTSAVAEVTCRTMMLTPVARLLMEKNDPELSLQLYGYLLGAEDG